jgi:hypothetical protein
MDGSSVNADWAPQSDLSSRAFVAASPAASCSVFSSFLLVVTYGVGGGGVAILGVRSMRAAAFSRVPFFCKNHRLLRLQARCTFFHFLIIPPLAVM